MGSHRNFFAVLIAVVLLVIATAVISQRKVNFASIYELQIDTVVVLENQVNITGEFVSSGSVYKGYRYEQTSDSLIIRIVSGLPGGHLSGTFSADIVANMSEIETIYLADNDERKVIWTAG